MEKKNSKPENKQKQTKPLDADAFAKSLKSLCFAIGGTHVAGWVEEAERAARQGKVIKYE